MPIKTETTVKPKLGRPPIADNDRRTVIRLPSSLWQALDAWRGRQSPIPSEHDAIRAALAVGLRQLK